MPPELRSIARIAPHRRLPETAAGLGAEFAAQGVRYKRMANKAGTIGEIWDALCPPGLIERTSVKVARGVLTISVRDAATRYRVERALKSGLSDTLVRQSPLAVRRVRVEIARIGGDAPPQSADRTPR